MVDVLVLLRVWRMCLPWCIELFDDIEPLLMLLSEPLIVEPVPVEPVPIVLPLGDMVESVAPDGLLIVPVPVPVPVPIEPEPVEPAVPDPVVCAAAAVAISAVAAITNIFMIISKLEAATTLWGKCSTLGDQTAGDNNSCTPRRVGGALRPMLSARFADLELADDSALLAS